MSGTRKPTRLRFESLEQRQVMAGDVEVFSIGGTLNIIGDSNGNGVLVHSTSAGVVQVKGIDRAGASTTVNDHPTLSFTNIRNIVINMGNGNDAVVLTNLNIPGAVSAQFGNGDDFIGLGEFENNGAVDSAVDALVGALTIGGNFAISMGEDNNTVSATNVVTKWAGFGAGNGNDTFTIHDHGTVGDPNYTTGLTATKGLTLIGGDGNNSVSLRGLNVMNVVMPLGNGDDTVSFDDVTVAKDTSITGNDGVNTITFDHVTSKSVDLTLGVGNDSVSFNNVTVAKKTSILDTFGDDSITFDQVSLKSLAISMGFGDDELSLTDVTATGGIDIATGDGADHVELQGIIAKSLDILLGLGDDELTLNDVAITGTAGLNGGDNNDTFDVDGLSAKKLIIALGSGNDTGSFEHIPISGKATIDGGGGNNIYADLGNTSFGLLKRLNFQTIIPPVLP